MVSNFPWGLQPFYVGLYKAVDDPSSDSIISWGRRNRSFIIWDHREFGSKIISSCGCANFLEFLYELKRWGFKTIRGSKHRFEFGSKEFFVRGRPHLLKMMQDKVLATTRLKFGEKEAREEELADGLHHLRI